MNEPRNEFSLGHMPTRDEIDLHLNHARTMRSEATAAFFASAAGGIARLAGRLVRRLGRMPAAGQARAKIEHAAAGASAGPRSPIKTRLGVRREQRRIHRELMAHSDRELEELGIARADISRIASSKSAVSAEMRAR